MVFTCTSHTFHRVAPSSVNADQKLDMILCEKFCMGTNKMNTGAHQVRFMLSPIMIFKARTEL